jgi:membrane protein
MTPSPRVFQQSNQQPVRHGEDLREESDMKRGTTLKLIKQTLSDWNNDKVPRLGAALAYYALFSIPPLVVLVIASIGLFYRGDVTQAMLVQLSTLMGADTARTVIEISQVQNTSEGAFAGFLGVGLLLFGATGVFAELQDAMNTIWGVQPKPGRGFLDILKDRFLSFTMILGIAFLLLVSMILTTLVEVVGSALASGIPGGKVIGHTLEIAASFAVVTILFAMMFKILPDVKIAWNDVWIGAAATSVLFTLGKLLIGVYLAKGGVATPYGAAGSVVIMIVWVYYSAQILFLGAEFTKVYTHEHGSRFVQATGNAEPVTTEQRAHQGLKPRETPPVRKAS